ncbi:twin-arginine translocation pathway signal [Mycolicibacterium peregrinum]|uniref:Twin-arginine translocation pathway signal n=1 Tax=Mycolicibacterium peregrinum TaxID=43304 RepID=A0A4Z0HRV6_MYCPR|nr:twin-arginine translocation pathway signal [Mycolicibacterium peregrinum]TGB43108.1 twin-arginine translocation pathway signal [Mycolicibacterium peregrinum]TGB44121.1 twin-arginine translocation pathway signal [Mycolicibacterium peregrinum]
MTNKATITDDLIDTDDESISQQNSAALTRLSSLRGHFSAVVLTMLVALSLGALAFVGFRYALPERSTNDRAVQSALAAATEGTTAMLTYTPTTVTNDIATAKAHMTGEFLTYYDEFTGQFVEPAAKMQQVNNKATVVRAAVSEIASDKAKVLVFINQESTSKDKPQPKTTASSVLVTLSKVDDKWLISSFDPNAAE